MTTTKNTDALDALTDNAREMDELNAKRWELIHAARQAGQTWKMIGEALGMSKQGAANWYRYNEFQYNAGRYDASPDAPEAAAPAVEKPAESLTDRIQATYAELVSEPGEWVGLLSMRKALADVERAELDAELLEMVLTPGVMIDPEFNQKTLTPADRAAALHMGGEECHLLAIGRR